MTPWSVVLRTSAGSRPRHGDPARRMRTLHAPTIAVKSLLPEPRSSVRARWPPRDAMFSTSLGLVARRAREPGVEDLLELGRRRRAQAQSEHVGVVPAPRARRGRRVAAQRRPDPENLVGRDRGAGPRPARDDRLLGPAVGHVAGRRLAGPRPVGTFALRRVGAVQHRLVPAPAKLLGDRRGDAGQLVRGQRDPHPRSRGQTAAIAGSRSSSGASSAIGSLAVLLEEPLEPVRPHVLDQRHQRPALVGQRVLDARRDLGERLPFDDPLLLEGAQPQRQRAGADAVQRALELAEPRAALGQVADQPTRGGTAGHVWRSTIPVPDGARPAA